MSDAPQGTFVVIPEISHSDSYIIKKKNPRHSVQSAGETDMRLAADAP